MGAADLGAVDQLRAQSTPMPMKVINVVVGVIFQGFQHALIAGVAAVGWVGEEDDAVFVLFRLTPQFGCGGQIHAPAERLVDPH